MYISENASANQTLGQYNYILSAGLDIGTALCAVFIGFIMGFGGFNFPNWWGNSIVETTIDFSGGAVTKFFDRNTSKPIGPEVWQSGGGKRRLPYDVMGLAYEKEEFMAFLNHY